MGVWLLHPCLQLVTSQRSACIVRTCQVASKAHPGVLMKLITRPT